jgi:putative ABC transport system permease protein
MLFGDRTKFLGVALGSFLCTFLITHMIAMFSGMMLRTYSLVSDIPQADIWVMHPAVQYCDEPIGMSDNALLRTRAVEGVQWATPLYVGMLQTRLPNGAFQGTLVIGVDDASLMGLPSHLIGCVGEDLRRADGAFVDLIGANSMLAVPIGSEQRVFGNPKIDHDGPRRPLKNGDEVHVNDHRLIVSGIVDLGPRFLAKPVLYTTYSRAVYISPPVRSLLSFILVKGVPGVDAATLARRIEDATDLRARTANEFKRDTYDYYLLKTGVVGRIVFMIATAVVVGLSVSSLLFYLFTNENARYYAALMALGCRNRTLMVMVLVQAIMGTFTGFGLGVGGSCLLGTFVKNDSMPYSLEWPVMAASGISILVVAVVAAGLSIRRILGLEPAMVFK